jgi:hypothetical protein
MIPSKDKVVGVVIGLLVLLLTSGGRSATVPSPHAAPVRELLQVQRSGKRLRVTLAPGIEQALHRRFPGYRVTDFGGFHPDIRTDLTERHPEPLVPFAGVGDFDRNGRPDVALLLKNRRRQWLLVAFHQTDRGTFRPYRIAPIWTHDPAARAYFFIEVLPLRHSGIRGTGIHVVWVEAASRLYYFRSDRYRYLQTSD